MTQSTRWVAPVVIEDTKMLKSIPSDCPIMIYQNQTQLLSVFYDQMQEICSTRQGIKGLAKGDPISVILGVLAGIDFFETDYPLDLAAKNKALILDPHWK